MRKTSLLLELTKKSGLTVGEVFGDKTYFRRTILDKIKENKAKAYIPVSEMAYRIDEDLFSYNKDSDEWFCAKEIKLIEKCIKKKGRKRAL